MNKEEAKLYIELLEIACGEGIASNEAVELGMKVADQHGILVTNWIRNP